MQSKKKVVKMREEEAPEGYRRLKVKEVIQDGDRALCKDHRMSGFAKGSVQTYRIGNTVEEDDGNYYYREISSCGPEWMADSRPLLAEIASLKAERDGLAKACAVAMRHLQNIEDDGSYIASMGAIEPLRAILTSLEVTK